MNINYAIEIYIEPSGYYDENIKWLLSNDYKLLLEIFETYKNLYWDGDFIRPDLLSSVDSSILPNITDTIKEGNLYTITLPEIELSISEVLKTIEEV